jgi:hypothetical protein
MLHDHPQPPALEWLLHQRQWWQPRQGPMVRIADMTDTHCYHLLGWLVRQSQVIARIEADRVIWSAIGSPEDPLKTFADALHASREALNRPVSTLRATPLYEAILERLPDPEDRGKWEDLLARAEHWSECPASRDLCVPCDGLRCDRPDPTYDEASGRGGLG